MATVVHEHTRENNGSGALIGLILLLVLAVLFILYGLPAIQSASTPQINVPGQVDVNVNTPQK